MKVLVLDLTHGGEVLARAYAHQGDEVAVVDIYHTASPSLVSSLEALGVEVLASAPPRSFDLGVAPIHCPDRYYGEARCEHKVTHHQAVGSLAKFPYPVIEVTGARGKTSTCQLLARILADRGKRVALLSSSGLSLIEKDRTTVLEDKVSIAPPTILKLSERPPRADLGVLEISLGGTGLGAVSVVTTIGDDYPIAGRTRRAFDGKVQMIEGARGTAVFPEAEKKMWSPHVHPGTDRMTFGPKGDLQLELKDLALGQGARLVMRDGDGIAEASLDPGYLAPSYTTGFGAAAAAARSLGIPLDSIAATLQSFKGAPGRGEVALEGGKVLVRERNPGVSAGSVDWNLRSLGTYGVRDVGMVLDPVNIKVCEKLDLEAVLGVARKHHATPYLLRPEGWEKAANGYLPLEDIEQVKGRHEVLLWCTKEGYL